VTRSNRRPLVVSAVAASAALAAGLLGACSAGQVAQTAGIEPGVAGVNGQAAGFAVYVRNAAVDYQEPKGYPKGAKAPVSFWVFNNTHEPVSLVSVTAAQNVDGHSAPVQVVLSGGASPSAGASSAPACSVPTSLAPATPPVATATSPAPSVTASAGSSGSTSAKSTPSVSASPSGSPSPSPSPSPSAAGSATIKVTIPAGGCLELSRRASQYVQAVDLPGPLGNADSLAVEFGFTTAGGQTFTIGQPMRLPVAPAESPLPRPTPSKGE